MIGLPYFSIVLVPTAQWEQKERQDVDVGLVEELCMTTDLKAAVPIFGQYDNFTRAMCSQPYLIMAATPVRRIWLGHFVKTTSLLIGTTPSYDCR